MEWQNLREEEFEEAVKISGGVCVVPIGCVEKHGQHLPVGTDIQTCNYVAIEAAKIEPVVVFPPMYFGDVMDEAFSLGIGEVGKVHEITSDIKAIYWVLIRTEKDDEHFTECYNDIASAFLSERIGQIISGVCDSLEASRDIDDAFASINHSEIKMP